MSLLQDKLYTENDKEQVIQEIVTYISHNNIYEHQLLHPGKSFVEFPSIIPKDIAKDINISTFANRLIDAGNVLKAQSIFIARQMPHIMSYLTKAGIKHSICYFKPTDIVMTELSCKALRSNDIEDAISSMGIENNLNKLNPFNIFYTMVLTINNPRIGFVKDMDRLYGINRSERDIANLPMHISILPTDGRYRRVDEIIRLIHKHY